MNKNKFRAKKQMVTKVITEDPESEEIEDIIMDIPDVPTEEEVDAEVMRIFNMSPIHMLLTLIAIAWRHSI